MTDKEENVRVAGQDAVNLAVGCHLLFRVLCVLALFGMGVWVLS